MKKIPVFLDTPVIIAYLRNDITLKDLFSSEFLKKIEYKINPIISQEILLLADSIYNKTLLSEIYKYIKNIPLDVDYNILMRFRNQLVHTNDILIINTAIRECDYLLTTDNNLLELKQIDSLKIISPMDFFKIVEEIQ